MPAQSHAQKGRCAQGEKKMNLETAMPAKALDFMHVEVHSRNRVDIVRLYLVRHCRNKNMSESIESFVRFSTTWIICIQNIAEKLKHQMDGLD